MSRVILGDHHRLLRLGERLRGVGTDTDGHKLRLDAGAEDVALPDELTPRGSNVAIVLVAIGVTAVVRVFFAVDTLRNAPQTFLAVIAIGVRRRRPRHDLEPPAPGAAALRRDASASVST